MINWAATFWLSLIFFAHLTFRQPRGNFAQNFFPWNLQTKHFEKGEFIELKSYELSSIGGKTGHRTFHL